MQYSTTPKKKTVLHIKRREPLKIKEIFLHTKAPKSSLQKKGIFFNLYCIKRWVRPGEIIQSSSIVDFAHKKRGHRLDVRTT